jgi:hypothetical protein
VLRALPRCGAMQSVFMWQNLMDPLILYTHSYEERQKVMEDTFQLTLSTLHVCSKPAHKDSYDVRALIDSAQSIKVKAQLSG